MMTGDTDRSAETRYTAPDGSGRNPREDGNGVSNVTARSDNSNPETSNLIEAVVERENMERAFARVISNKGCAGVDNMPVTALKAYLCKHWKRIKAELLEGRYEPSPVLRVEIEKPGGKGMRQLGIPTVVDRLIQQGLHQVMRMCLASYFVVRP